MPKKKTADTARNLKTSPSTSRASRTIPIAKRRTPATEPSTPNPTRAERAVPQNSSRLPASFENKAGRYELIRIDGDQAYYSFTNRFNKTVDATMSVITWRKMQERAEAAFKETA